MDLASWRIDADSLCGMSSARAPSCRCYIPDIAICSIPLEGFLSLMSLSSLHISDFRSLISAFSVSSAAYLQQRSLFSDTVIPNSK